MQERFRIYINEDLTGVQLSGALKNIIAIAAGVVDGLNLGDNAKAALLIRGIVEMARLGKALGADTKTFAGLSGMGDLLATCSSKLSRNHFVGEQIAKGRKLKDILASMKDVAEGVSTARAAYALSQKRKIEMPIVSEVHAVLFEGKDPYLAISALMTRTPKGE
jgi:glycerol-3-phosphate dehydrogenase (NAD(P)+)